MKTKRLKAALLAVAIVALVPGLARAAETSFTAYTTGYGWWDNTPAGSLDISNPVIHSQAGGVGTYADPITLAVGHVIRNGVDTLDFPAGTRWYIPNLRRYFIVEDTCGDGPTPQNGPCHSLAQADPGAQVWLDLFVDGSTMSHSASNACEDAITANHLAIENPASDYAVVAGPIASASCSNQFGDAITTAGMSTPPPPPSPPPPPPAKVHHHHAHRHH